MDITYHDASYCRQPYGHRKVRRTEARLGWLSAYGATKSEAKAALLEAVALQCEHAGVRRYLRTDEVTFALSYTGGWRYDIIRGDGFRSCSTLLGDVMSEHEAMEHMQRHFDQFTEAPAAAVAA